VITERNPRSRRSLPSCAGVVALLVFAAAGAAQAGDKPAAKPFAVIAGTVWTAEHRAAAGVRVRVRRADEKKFRGEGISDARGEFAFRVPAEAADYVVVAEPGGRRRAVEKAVHIDFDERADIGLHLTE
jgi:hypothetical protein